jgi:hypothetical protein
MSKILTGTVFLMIFGWFVFVNNIDYGIAPKGITKGWPMISYHSHYEIDREYPKALALNWGLALVVSVVGTVGAGTVYRIVVSRLSQSNKQEAEDGSYDGRKRPN